MARAEVASASARPDSIKGLAQSVANPAYRRLLIAEPTLRRAVPVLIVAFLITVGVGAIVQVLEHRKQALTDAVADIENLADVVGDRLDRNQVVPEFATPNQVALAHAVPTRATAAGRRLL